MSEFTTRRYQVTCSGNRHGGKLGIHRTKKSAIRTAREYYENGKATNAQAWANQFKVWRCAEDRWGSIDTANRVEVFSIG